MDIVMPELSGLEATRRIRRLLPKTEVLVLSLHYSDQLAREVIEAGARGYVLKSDAGKDLLRAIRAVSNHQPYFTSPANEVLSKGVCDQNPEAPSSVSIYKTLTEGRTCKGRGTCVKDRRCKKGIWLDTKMRDLELPYQLG